jgi:amino acid transporter
VLKAEATLSATAPGPFGYYLLGDTPVGTFLGAWYAFPNALFAYIGTELVGVTVGECKNPRKQVPKAIKVRTRSRA